MNTNILAESPDVQFEQLDPVLEADYMEALDYERACEAAGGEL